MKISKYIHSCVLVQEGGSAVLIDPGPFSFMEGKVKPESFKNIEAVLITHDHPDHYDPKAIKVILENSSSAKIFTSQEVSEALKEEGIESFVLENAEIATSSFSIKSFKAKHEPLPAPVLPTNLAYVINGKFLHPGDSLEKIIFEHKVDALALPVAGPFLRMVDALQFVSEYSPKEVVPIHDAMIKEFFTDWQYQSWQNLLQDKGMHFNALKNPGDSFEIS